MNARKCLAVLPGVIVLLSSCTSTDPVQLPELAEQGRDHWERVLDDRASLEGPLTLYEALALGLERNLRFRRKSLEAALASNNQKLASWSMLPSLTAKAGYSYRDPQQASVSQSVETGRVSLAASTAQEQERTTGGLNLSWNMLDMGLAWYARQRHGNEMLVAEEERVRMVHSVTREIVYAWDQAAAYESVRNELTEARRLVRRALDQSEKIARARLRDPAQTLEYRKSLLLILKRINRLTGEMAQARAKLMRMLNLPAGSDLELAPTPDLLTRLPEVSASRQEWQLAALLRRPEARSAFYKKRIADQSAAERLLKLFPDMILDYGYQYDDNEFLIDNSWREAGARVSWNLLKLASWPYQKRQSELEQERAEVGAQLQLTAVLSQVAIAEQRLEASRKRHCISDQLEDIESARQRIMTSRQEKSALDRLTLIKAQMDLLLTKLENALDRAEYRRSVLMMLSSSGLGVTPDSLDTESGEETVAQIRLWVEHGLKANVNALFANVEDFFPDAASSRNPVTIESNPCTR